MTKKVKNTSYKKLGYNSIDTAQIVNSLNLPGIATFLKTSYIGEASMVPGFLVIS